MTQENEKNVTFIVKVYTGRRSWFALELGSSIQTAIYYLREIKYDRRNGRMYPSTSECLSYFGINYEFDTEMPLVLDLGCAYMDGDKFLAEIWVPLLSFKQSGAMLERGFELLRSAVLIEKKRLYHDILKSK